MNKPTTPRDGDENTWMKRRLVGRKRRRRTKGSPEDRTEAGETLLEVLLALIVLSLASVALIAAFGTSINASAEHRSLANFDTILASSISTTSSVIQQQYADVFSTCQPLSSYPSPAVLTAALDVTNYTAAIAPTGSQAAVEYSSAGAYSTSCSSGVNGDVGNPQLINVVVTDTATGISQNDTVVVDNPTVIQTAGDESGTANSLIFTTQPEGATVNSPFLVQPVLEVQDCTPNPVLGQPPTCSIVTSDASPLSSLTIASGPSGASLSSDCSHNETAGVATFSGCSLNVVGAGYTLFASEPDPSDPTQDLTATSAPFSVYAAQLITPSNVTVVPSKNTAGAVNVSFTGAPNAPNGEAYSVKVCTDAAMSANCVTKSNFASGTDVTGLLPGSSYYAQVTAAASQNFLGSTSPPGGPGMASVLLQAPPAPTLADGTTAGTLIVTYSTSPNAPTNGETYTLKACTNQQMTSACLTPNTNFPFGGTLTVPFTPGSAGTPYFVTITPNASTGYLVTVASTSPPSAGLAALSSIKPPTAVSATPSASTAGAIMVSFTKPTGSNIPTSYTATVCTDSNMTQNCITTPNYTSGAQLTGLTAGNTYYATITGVSGTSGLLSATVGPSSAMATVQLALPTITSVNYGATAGSVSITGGSPGAPAGTTYTAKACTNQLMSTGCLTPDPTYVPGTDFAEGTYITGSAANSYYVTLTANGSTGYLGTTASNAVNHAETGQLNAPGNETLSGGSSHGSVKVTFTAPTGSAPGPSYTVEVCPSQTMTGTGCVTVTNYTMGAQITTGIVSRQNYWAQVTEVAPVGYLIATPTTFPNNRFGVQAT